MRKRLYLESMESALWRTNKDIVDQQGDYSLMNLPIDRLVGERQGNQAASVTAPPMPTTGSSSTAATTDRNRIDRSREVRL